MTENEIREKLTWYANFNGWIKTEEEYEFMKKLVLENVDIAKEVIMSNERFYGSSDNRRKMIIQLFKNGQGEDVALFEARRLAFKLSFYRCMPRVERMVKNWLACKTDEMPTE